MTHMAVDQIRPNRMMSGNITAPPDGHVHLVLFEQPRESFYLEIPLRVITDVCRHPPKYLHYLGWCVLGVEGSLQDAQGRQVDLNGNLVDRGIYYYRLPATQQDILSYAVDLEIVKLPSHAPSETQDSFHQELATRDGLQCVWTGLPASVGMHISPWSKGDEWLQLIIKNRDERRLDSLKSINDIRNGIMGTATFYPSFNSRTAVILKTPNPILPMDDVPEQPTRNLPNNANYPTSSRYTLQWLADDNPFVRQVFPNNSDAAFVSQKPKPSDLLLHYNYGAAAVKNWGRNHDVLSDRHGLPRPQIHVTTTIAKNGGSAAAIDSEQPVWDEDDVMLFFWANSKSATERHAKEEQECRAETAS
ncbi:hypothetical protein F5887DRAFT_492297 [Amanita rubescens]|nr:hypothetical protein F5887DRAFT_492297 [Amanita rubescens]